MPKNTEDLQYAVAACLKLSLVGDCSMESYGPIGEWDVSQVTDMNAMFSDAISFNQDLSKWNVGKVTNMEMMFNGATSFKRSICGEAWLNSKANQRSMFIGSPGATSCERFEPQNREELVVAVNSCRGGCCSLM